MAIGSLIKTIQDVMRKDGEHPVYAMSKITQ